MSKIYLKCTTIQELAEVCQKYLITGTRTKEAGGQSYVYTADNAPKWFKDLVKKAHDIDDVMPNDYIYQFIKDALYTIAESSDPQEAIYQIEPDCYNHDLLKWISDNLSFSSWVDEAIQDYSTTKDLTLFDALMRGQQKHREEIAQCVFDCLETRLGEIKRE